MILLIVGAVLLLFGLFVFFKKKNDIETEISLFGAKLKSGSSSILLVIFGGLLIAFGAVNMDGKPQPGSEEKKPIVMGDSNTAVDQPSQSPDDTRQKLLGKWSDQEIYTGKEALLKLFANESEIPQNVEASLSSDERISFYANNSYEDEAVLNLQMTGPAGTQDVRFRVATTATWKVIAGKLVATITDGSITPLNNVAQTLFQANQPHLEDFDLAIGSTHSFEIVDLTESALTIVNEKTKEKSTLIKRS